MNEAQMIATLVRVENERELFDAGVPGHVGFDMGNWYSRNGYSEEGAGEICGTTACLAGHAAMLAGYTQLGNHSCKSPKGISLSIESVGTHVLGLTQEEAADLFYLNSLDEVYEWVADKMGVAEVVLRDKVQAQRGLRPHS